MSDFAEKPKREPEVRSDALLDALNLSRERLKDFHDILYTLAQQNGGELRFTPPVTRHQMVRIYLDAATNEVVVSSNTEARDRSEGGLPPKPQDQQS